MNFKIIHLINEIAFKSTTEMRSLMKDYKLLELRDNLIIAMIQKTYV